jgi:hypothetical protein
MTFGVEHLDAVVGGVGDEGFAGGVGGEPARERELAGLGAEAAPFGDEPERGVELDHAMVDVVGDVDVAGGVERDPVGEVEAVAGRAFGAVGAFELAGGAEFLDAVVVVVGDEHLGGVRDDAARVGELPAAGAVGAPFGSFAAFEVEALDPVVARVGDVYVAAVDGDPAARRLGRIQRGAEVELAEFLAEVPPVLDVFAGGRELLDPVVLGVDDVDVPGGIGREAADRAELAVAAAEGAPLAEVLPGGVELLHDERQLVGDVDVAERVDGDRLGKAQHTFGAHADDHGRGVRAFPVRARARRGTRGSGRDPRERGTAARQRESAGEGSGEPDDRATHPTEFSRIRGWQL